MKYYKHNNNNNKKKTKLSLTYHLFSNLIFF